MATFSIWFTSRATAAWRAVADEYPGRVLIGEIWLADAARLARYLRPDELHTVFNLELGTHRARAAALLTIAPAAPLIFIDPNGPGFTPRSR